MAVAEEVDGEVGDVGVELVDDGEPVGVGAGEAVEEEEGRNGRCFLNWRVQYKIVDLISS
ncbi:MAG TPA: hypothetical protein VLL52_13905 [Anaerolineae bacterium]|nr:hypothetical protein [Anaerolineae bacterium]